jgi:hypothetical protein
VAGDHIAVTAVIALAAHDQDGLSLGIESHEEFGSASAGVFHQDNARNAELLDGSAIELADLGSG